MKIGDEIYNKHFREMIIDALVCGLKHPIEWIENYDRGICQPNNKLQEITEFCNLAIKELYFLDRCSDGRKNSIEEVTMEECNEWIKNYYNQ